MRVVGALSMALTLLLLACESAQAARVEPGEMGVLVGLEPDRFEDLIVPPPGNLVAEVTKPFTLEYDLTGTGWTPSGPTSFELALTSQVLRDPATQHLTFVYRVQPGEDAARADVGREGSDFSVSSFEGFRTDVSGLGFWVADRSADGATINALHTASGDGFLPHVLIETDATSFNSQGDWFGTIDTELSAISPEGIATGRVSLADYSVSGVFQPVIPLPAGVWPGLIALCGGGIALRVRRWLANT